MSATEVVRAHLERVKANAIAAAASILTEDGGLDKDPDRYWGGGKRAQLERHLEDFDTATRRLEALNG